MRLSIPYTAIQNTPRKPKFWNSELSAQRKELRHAQRAWRNDIGNVTLRNIYSKMRCDYKRSIEKARFKCTSDTITSISNVKNMSQLVKICQGIDNKTLGMLETKDGMTDSISGTLKHLMAVHFPGSKVAKGIMEARQSFAITRLLTPLVT